jgi:HK97 family phage portal protein
VIVRTTGGDWDLRSSPQFPGATVPSPMDSGWYGGTFTPLTSMANLRDAIGIPVVLDAIRLVAETIAGLPCRVCMYHGADKKMLERSWQWKLLHWAPNPEQSAFDFWCDVAANVEATGNAFIQKVRSGPYPAPLDALYTIDPGIVGIRREDDTGEKVFDVYGLKGTKTYGSDTILHVRGFTPKGGDRGMSPIQLMANVTAAGVARTRFEQHFFQNNTQLGGVISTPEDLTRERAQRILEVWEASHAGPENAGRPAVLGKGATWTPYGMSLQDAQFIDGAKFTVEEVSRGFNLPLSLLNGTVGQDTEQESRRFMNFSLGNRLRRIEMALKADRDLFGVDSVKYPEFYVDDFIRPDAATKAEIRHKELQTGVLLVDEARAEKGLPPLPNGQGQIPQIVPVGGSPFGVPANGNGNGNAPDGGDGGNAND